ncbi:TAXI family protein [Candidatus Terasakiella magnetica]|uniref:TAXI family protein n=1 Tax=Candidatus Terasakiella magnetica TaxID=1867952 RepID=A0A1C3RKD8_9PROT|nr:TAXI family TRAP transporter solute-binding subunit [Candidatus Terasakiella magnetica]SCA57790.1 TAXI family protein [Candidatus Terasakiella magnetica]
MPVYKIIWCLAVMLGALFAALPFAHASQMFITIGTAGVTGVYYPTGGAICRLVNKERKEHGIRCSVESTDGSAHNITSIREDDLNFGIAQSDVQAAAWSGSHSFEEAGRFKKLRAVFSVHGEPLQLVVRKDAGIDTFKDVKGKRVNLGNIDSGQRETMMRILGHLGWDEKDFSYAGSLKSTEQSKALCNNKLDAVFFTAGIPNASVKEATTSCDTKLISMTGQWVDSFIAKYPQYSKAVIPAGTYRGTESDIHTLGPKATVVSSTKTSDEIVYQVVRSVMDHFSAFKKLHPAFKHIKKSQMIKDGLSAPLHRGAIKYYKEVGLLK